MPMTCVTAGCTEPCHKDGDRFCADHMIEYLRGSLNHAHHEAIQGLTLSLRDRFAGQALAGMCGHPCALSQVSDKDLAGDARLVYRIADAMLAARNEGAQ